VFQKSRGQWRVHVDGSNFCDYLCSSSLAECTDPSPKVAPWIHACKEGKRHYDRYKSHNEPLLKSLPCQGGDFEVCQIKPSAMYFTQKQMGKLEAAGHDRVVSVSQGGSNYRVCYSTHSSYQELERFVRHFAPAQITPCAIPSTNPPTTKDDVAAILASWLGDDDVAVVCSPSSNSPPLPLSPSRSPVVCPPGGGGDKYDPDCMFSPSPPGPPHKAGLKRKMSSFDGDSSHSSHSSQGAAAAWGASSQPKLLKLETRDSSSKISFDDTMDIEGKIIQGEPDSSDDEDLDSRYRVEIIPSNQIQEVVLPDPQPPKFTTSICSKADRRKMFARSKSGKTCYSMPVPNESDLTTMPKERRKSMPSNMKMPVIKVTPSSPSPDPNHPDYPEFFEDKLYLELTNRSNSPPPPASPRDEGMESFSLVLEPDEDEDMVELIRLNPDRSQLRKERQNSLMKDSFDFESESFRANLSPVDLKASCSEPSKKMNMVSHSVDVTRIDIRDTDITVSSHNSRQESPKFSVSLSEARPPLDSSGQEDDLKDTPEIEDLLDEAEKNNMPQYVIKTLEETRRNKENVIYLD